MSEVIYKPLDSAVKRKWSDEDARFVLENCLTMFVEDIAIHTHRTVKAVKRKAEMMGCSILSKPKGVK